MSYMVAICITFAKHTQVLIFITTCSVNIFKKLGRRFSNYLQEVHTTTSVVVVCVMV